MSVNLDAMIPRADFDSDAVTIASEEGGKELYLTHLTPDGRLAIFRKPDFQRETSSWKPEIVAEFIRSVVDGDVIPAMIMWRSPVTGESFVIDGAHRLSALIAWILDDYGDRAKSREFFQHDIAAAQEAAATRTRELVNSIVGPFAKLRAYARVPETAPDEKTLLRSRRITDRPLVLQHVTGNAVAAEASFLRINSTAVAINETEKELINLRRKPSALAARALVRAGTGHDYWAKFGSDMSEKIRSAARSTYDQLIKPIAEFPVITLDLPVPSRGYSANSLKTVLDLVTYLNAPAPGSKRLAGAKAPDDVDGTATLDYLNRMKKVSERAFGKHQGSLGLHPGIYCYGATGKFIPKAFIGTLGFVIKLEQNNWFFKFTTHRSEFEQFLIDHSHFLNEIGRGQGSGGTRGVAPVIRLYEVLLEAVANGDDVTKIMVRLAKDKSLSALSTAPQTETSSPKRRFTKDDKTAVLLSETLAAAIRCPMCRARLYVPVRSHDHRKRVEDGGASTKDNMQLMHPYCNTGYKEALHAKAEKETKSGH